jgi:signal transduction histidine kinase
MLKNKTNVPTSGYSRKHLEALLKVNRQLKKEIVQRKAAQAALVKSEKHHRLLSRQSLAMEQRLRHLSHQILSAQEEERKKISRELHDQIAQMLAGINAHLAALQTAAAAGNVGLNQKIRATQRMVEKSVNVVHRFARELRPPVLDDLGFIPALQSYLKHFSERTGVLVRLTVFAGVEKLHDEKRTALYRVAQAALLNVGQHAKASLVVITIMKKNGAVEMSLHDDGRAFDVQQVLLARKSKRLGLLGMRERVEMVVGSFSVKSAPAKGTTIGVRIALGRHKSALTS